MAKNIVQDVVSGKRSIRDISLPSRRRTSISSESRTAQEVEEPKMRVTTRGSTRDIVIEKSKQTKEDTFDESKDDTSPTDYNFEYDIDRPVKKSRFGIFALGFVFVLASIFGVVSIFASAKLYIVSKNQTIPLQLTLTAQKDQPVGQFGYQIVSISKSFQKEVNAGASAQVDVKALGTIVIYNNSNTVQNLIATTRFESPSGLVYRITKNVSVPKSTTLSGKVTPGSVIAEVTADQAGDKFNIGLSDFTLPGLKGTSKFSEIYARSKTTMSGGFSGMRKVVDSAVLGQTSVEMKNSLQLELANQIGAELPQNFVLFPSSIAYAFSEITQNTPSDSPEGKVTLSLSGTASAVIFDRVLLSQKIISEVASSSSVQGQVQIKNLDDLKFTLIQPTAVTKDYLGNLSFQLVGDAKFVWLFDHTALKNDLVGMKKTDLNALLQAKYPSIIQVQAKIFPIWKSSFPSDTDKISLSLVDAL